MRAAASTPALGTLLPPHPEAGPDDSAFRALHLAEDRGVMRSLRYYGCSVARRGWRLQPVDEVTRQS